MEVAIEAAMLAFWRERHLCTLSTVRPDGRPHVVAVGAVLDAEADLAWIITRRGSRKVRNIQAGGAGGAPVAICQVDGGRWATIEGHATVTSDPEVVAEAEQRYAQRYRFPQPNPERVAIVVRIDRILGSG